MIPSTRNQILLFLGILLFQSSYASAETYTLSPMDDSKMAVKKSVPGDEVIPKDRVNLKSEIVNSTTVRWYLDFSSMLSRYPKKINPDYSQFIEVNVSYHLLYGELSKYHTEIFCKLQERILMAEEPKIHQEHCRKEMYSFRLYNASEDDFNINIDYHCDSQHEIFKVKFGTASIIAIGNLLPHQSYEFRIASYVTLNDIQTLVDSRTEYVCLSDGSPQFPPQTDLASFSLPPNYLVGGDNHFVDLYWRPVPRILAGSENTKYEVYCETDDHREANNRTLGHMIDGHFRIKKPTNLSYMCKIRSKNQNTYAPGYSPIIIPDRDHLIDLGSDFRFYAYAVSNEEYWLEWTPIRFDAESRKIEILSRNSARSELDNTYGNFTIYWCIAGRAQGCSNLAGIVRTRKSESYILILPPRSEVAPRLFGISYIHKEKNEAHSTGIIWSKCVVDFSHQFMTEKVEISNAAAVENDHTSISINWDFSGCNSQVAIIESYEINYCRVRELKGCSIVWSSHTVEDLSKFRFEASSDRCATISYANKFRNDANISNLTSSSRYIIRLRYILANGTANPWSEPKSAITSADPMVVGGCWTKFKWNFSVLTFFVCITIAICCTKSKNWFNHCSSIKYKFKRTTESICSFVTNVTANERSHEATLKYCSNGGKDHLTRAQSDLSLSFLTYDDRLKLTSPDGLTNFDDHIAQTRYNHMDQIFDYIPKNLIEGSADDTTLDSNSHSNRDAYEYENSSEQDEISVNSHPLVWETNSNDELDFNNNQTNK